VKRIKNGLVVLVFISFTSCIGQRENSIDTSVTEISTIKNSQIDLLENIDEINLTDTIYFNTVKDYIKSVGTIKKVNASSTVTKELIITYFQVSIDSMQITVDNTNRIYMSLNNNHYGNILKDNNTITPEINYGVPNTDPQLTKAKELLVLKFYKKLIIQALHK
jgi:ASC-1-like (ASCH) protein